MNNDRMKHKNVQEQFYGTEQMHYKWLASQEGQVNGETDICLVHIVCRSNVKKSKLRPILIGYWTKLPHLADAGSRVCHSSRAGVKRMMACGTSYL
jgi:hypothetical protein